MTTKNVKRGWTVTSPKEIEEWKNRERLSWGTVAKRLGVAVETVRMWRKGETVPTADRQKAIAAEIGGTKTEAGAPPAQEAPAAKPKKPKTEVANDGQRRVEQTQSGRLLISLMGASQLEAEEIARIVLQALADAKVSGVALIHEAKAEAA